MQTSLFSLFKKAAKELPCRLMDLLELIMTLWQWFTIHCNALEQQYYVCICVGAWKQKTTCVPYYKQPVQTRATSTGRLEEVWRWFWGALQGRMEWDQQRGEGRENRESEDKQGKWLGSLVRCGEVVLGHQEKREALQGEEEHAAGLINFEAINIHFPRGNLWLCNVGNSLFADLNAEPPEYQIILKMSQDLKQLNSELHFPWHWMKSTER